MAANAGSVYAEAELNIDKFKAAAAQLGGEGAKIASAMDKCAVGLEKAQGNLETLGTSLEAAMARMSATSSIFDQSTASLSELQSALDAARAKTDELGEAYEQAVNKFGKDSLQAFEVGKEFDEALAAQEALEAQMDKQQATVHKNEAAFKRAAAAVKSYENKIAATEGTIANLDSQMEGLNSRLQAEVMGNFGDAAGITAERAGDLSGVLGNMLSRTASSASRSLGTLTAKTLGLNTSSAAGIMAARGLSTGLREVIKSAGAATLAQAAVGGALAYGAYKFYDYASGAKAAREAMESLNETAEKWQKTQAKTVYDTGDNAFEAMGVSADSFKKTESTAKDWLSSLTRTWTDGKKETNEIVSDYVSKFTSGSDKIRDAIETRRAAYADLGVTDTAVFDGMDAQIKQLDAYDKEIEKLLKKRQNGYLTEDELLRLDTITQAKIDLEVEYGLAETSGFEQILAQVEADRARLAAEGKTVGTDTYANAMTAAAQGLNDYKEALAGSYSEQYKMIAAMEDGSAKTEALNALNERYATDLKAVQQEYAQTIQQLYTGLSGSKEVAEGAQGFNEIVAAVNDYNAATTEVGQNTAIQNLSDTISNLDEGALVSYLALATQIADLSAQGFTETEISEMFPELDISDILGGYTTVADFLNAHMGEVEGLEGIFGEGGAVPEELQRIMATLELDTSEADAYFENSKIVKAEYDATDAKVDDPDPVQCLIDAYTKATDAGMPEDPTVQAVIDGYKQEGSVTSVDWSAAANAVIEYYKANPGAQVDQSLIDSLTAYISVYDDSAATPPTLPPIEQKVVLKYERLETADEELNSGEISIFGLEIAPDAVGNLDNVTDAIHRYNDASLSIQEQPAPESIVGSLDAINLNGTVDSMIAFIDGYKSAAESGQEITPQMEATAQSIIGFVNALNGLELNEDVTTSLVEGLSANGWTTTADTLAADVTAALGGIDLAPAGQSAGEGYGVGLAGTDISGDAQTFVTGAREAVGAAEGEGSPATLFMPAGESAGQGFGVGLSQTDVSADAQAFIESVLAALIASASTGFDTVGQTITTQFAASLTSGASAASANVDSLVLAVKSPLEMASSDASTLGSTFATNFAGGISAAAGTVSADASSMVTSALAAARGGVSGAQNIGSMISAGVASGIRAGQSGVVNAARSMVQAAVAAAKSAAQINSPSKITTKFGQFWDEGWAVGIEKYTDIATAAASGMVDDTIKVMDGLNRLDLSSVRIITPDIEDSIREALYIEPPAGAASTVFAPKVEATPVVKVKGQGIDYKQLSDVLVDAVKQQNLVFTMNDRRIAQAMAAETARAQNARSRSIAMGYGKRG